MAFFVQTENKVGRSNRLYPEVAWNRAPNGEKQVSPDWQCAADARVDTFNGWLEGCQCFYTPCLAWKDFLPYYISLFLETTSICVSENNVIPAFLDMVFEQRLCSPREGMS